MSNHCFFSIIIPTYQRSVLLQKTLQSLLLQSYPHFEIIVVDDGGTDDTEAMIQQLADDRIKYFWKENGERGAARNFGMGKSKGDYINFFDSDDLASAEHLQVAQNFIEAQNTPPVFHVAYGWANAAGKIIRLCKDLPSPLNSTLKWHNPLSCNGVFLRRDLAARFPFEQDRCFNFMEDYLVWLQIAQHYPIQQVNIPTSYIVAHGGRGTTDTRWPVLKKSGNCFAKRITELANQGALDPATARKAIGLSKLQLAYSATANGGLKLVGLRYGLAAFLHSPLLIFTRLFWMSLKNIFTRY